MRCNVITLGETGERARRSAQQRTSLKPKCRRVLGIVAMLVALGLIVGSIYLHLRQKHHLGRLHLVHSSARDNLDDTYNTMLVTVPGVAAAQQPQRIVALPTPDNRSQLVAADMATLAPSSDCLQCICEVTTQCKPVSCHGVPCGPFRISQPYWQDVNIGLASADYERCVTDEECMRRVVAAYVLKYAHDCTGDGLIDCRDFTELHILGPGGCRSSAGMSALFVLRMETCFNRVGIQTKCVSAGC